MKFIKAALLLILCILGASEVQAATTILPPGQTCYAGVNGAYSSGSMNYFVPNTTTPKATYKDSGQAALNTQPIQLDANGCAVVYGVGSYRQQLFDGPVVGGVTTGNLIFDLTTTDTSAYNSVFWAGIAAGTPNVITIVDPGFNGTDGTVVQFVALSTNTGSTTINPSGFGAILVQKSTTGGPISLVGGEIVQGNVISAVYSASSNTFQLLNAVIQSVSGAAAPLCGATGLKITNNGVTPNTIINLTADQEVMLTAAGIVQSRNNVSLTAINISTGNVTSTPNGMDGEAPGTSAWLNIWIIDNGAAPAGLVSLSATSPTLPSGYTFKCRVGAMRVDGSGNLLRTLQVGNRAHYVVTTGSNVATLPQFWSSNPGGGSWTTYAVANFIPPTATSIWVALLCQGDATGSTQSVLMAPNSSYNVNTSGNGSPFPYLGQATNASTVNFMQAYGEIVLESTNIFGQGQHCAPSNAAAEGWRDKVNAN